MEIARAERGWAGDNASRANRTGTADISYSAIQVCPVEAEKEFAQALNVERGLFLLVAPDIVGRQGVSLADGSHADARSEGCGLPSFISLTRRVTSAFAFALFGLSAASDSVFDALCQSRPSIATPPSAPVGTASELRLAGRCSG